MKKLRTYWRPMYEPEPAERQWMPSLKSMSSDRMSPSVWELRAAEQLAMCLVHAGRRGDLEKLLADVANTPREAGLRYAISLDCVRQQDWEAAIAQLRQVLAQNPDHIGAHTLARKIIPPLASLKFKKGDWEGLSSTLSTALELGVDGDSTAPWLEPYRKVLPICLVKAGRREEAARIWTDQLRNDPGDPSVLHNLALLYYWWARSEERTNSASLHGLWEVAIAYWTTLARHDQFWLNWRKDKERNWGIALANEDLETLRTLLLTANLGKLFQDRASELRETGMEAEARLYEEHLTALQLEAMSAEWWQRAVSLCSPLDQTRPSIGPEARPLLTLPGGYLFFRHLGLLREVGEHVDAVAERNPGEDCVTKLKIYYSPAGLGKICVALEQRKNPEQAIELLRRLPEDARNLPETRYLLSTALSAKAHATAARGEFDDAFRQWLDATRRTEKTLGGLSSTCVFRPLLERLRGQISEQVEKAVQTEVARRKENHGIEEAIRLLESAIVQYPLEGLKEYLCIFYCDRASPMMGDKRFADARREFSRALQVKSDYQRARIGMATAYNNEAMEKSDPARAISLLEQALVYEPESPVVQKNLAQNYNSRAVEILNGLGRTVGLLGAYGATRECDAAIEVLKKAVKILNPQLADHDLYFLKLADDDAIEQITTAVKDQLLRLVLKHFAIAHRQRRQLSTM